MNQPEANNSTVNQVLSGKKFKIGPCELDLAYLIKKVQHLFRAPREAFGVISEEVWTVKDLFFNIIIPLTVIGNVATFFRFTIFGIDLGFTTFHWPIIGGIVATVVNSAIAVAGVYVAGQVFSRLAEFFEAQCSFEDAIKWITFSFLPLWLAGILNVFPMLAVLIMAFLGIFGIYLLFMGADIFAKVTPTKKFPYMAAGIVVTIIANAILGFCAAMFAPKPPMPEINFDKIESGISDITNKMLNQIQQPE